MIANYKTQYMKKNLNGLKEQWKSGSCENINLKDIATVSLDNNIALRRLTNVSARKRVNEKKNVLVWNTWVPIA